MTISSILLALTLLQTPGGGYQGIAPSLGSEAYVKASNTGLDDIFGDDVAIHGDTLVVGAPDEASAATGIDGDQIDNSAYQAGAVYVYVRTGSSWTQQAYIKASNAEAGDRFGKEIALHGDTLVVGASREGSAATGIDGDQTDNSAFESGAAYVFVRNGTTWTQQAYLKASNTEAGDRFGSYVEIQDDTIIVTSMYEDSAATGIDGDQADNTVEDSGAAYVFVRSGTTWTQQAYLKASNAGPFDTFGSGVSLSADTLVVGAEQESSSATGIDGNQADDTALESGAAYVFVRTGTNWSQQAYLKASNTDAADRFGESVTIDGDTVVVCAEKEWSGSIGVDADQSDNSIEEAGAAYVFVRDGTTWSQQAYLKATNPGDEDNFGDSCDLSGDLLVIGAWAEDSDSNGVNSDQDDNSANRVGAAYVFERSGTTWGQVAYVKALNSGHGDQYGGASDIDGDTIVVGSKYEDSVATGINGDPSDDSVEDSGAAYVYRFVDGWGTWADLGGSSAGVAGNPRLTGRGPLISSSGADMIVDRLPPSAPMLAWISLAPSSFAAVGGTVHAFPFTNQIPLVSSVSGTWYGSTTWPASLPSGTETFFQFIVQDATSPHGLTMSNGLRAITP